jgi:hypothetical protein
MEDDKGKVKQLTLDQLKEEIELNLPTDALLLLPEAKRLTTGFDSGLRI